MITPKRALEIIFQNIRALRIVRQPLRKSPGFCLAETVRADRDMPAADCSAMDGYAVRSRDLRSLPCSLRLTGEVGAGSSARPRVLKGACVRILTGANIPPGADAVVKLESTTESNGNVIVHEKVSPGENIRLQGEEARRGSILLRPGTALTPIRIGLCAAVGKAMVRVHARPRIAIVITGKEVRRADESVGTHELRDSNGPALSSALNAWGFICGSQHLVPDDVKTMTRLLKRIIQSHDVILITGGVSVGKYDYVPRVIKDIGASIQYHGVAMKPGRPQLYATLKGNRHIFGLPGYPLSVMSGFHEFALPALRRLSGMPAELCQPDIILPLAASVNPRKDHRAHLIPAKLIWKSKGPAALPVFFHGSGDMAGIRQTDGVVMIPPDAKKRRAGSMITFRPWRPFP